MHRCANSTSKRTFAFARQIEAQRLRHILKTAGNEPRDIVLDRSRRNRVKVENYEEIYSQYPKLTISLVDILHVISVVDIIT